MIQKNWFFIGSFQWKVADGWDVYPTLGPKVRVALLGVLFKTDDGVLVPRGSSQEIDGAVR